MKERSFMVWRKQLLSISIKIRQVINWCAILVSRMMELKNRWVSNLLLWTRNIVRRSTITIVPTLLIFSDQSTSRLITTLMTNESSKSRRIKPTILLLAWTKVALILEGLQIQPMLSLENLASLTRKDKNSSFSRVHTLSSKTTSRTMVREYRRWVLLKAGYKITLKSCGKRKADKWWWVQCWITIREDCL